MLKHLSENDTIGEIRQSSRHPIGKTYVWVLVEGIADQKLYTKLLDRETTKVEIVHGGGIKALRDAMPILVNENDRVIGIRDAGVGRDSMGNFRRRQGKYPESPGPDYPRFDGSGNYRRGMGANEAG